MTQAHSATTPRPEPPPTSSAPPSASVAPNALGAMSAGPQRASAAPSTQAPVPAGPSPAAGAPSPAVIPGLPGGPPAITSHSTGQTAPPPETHAHVTWNFDGAAMVALLGIIVSSIFAWLSWKAAERSANANKNMATEAERLRREQAQPYVLVYMHQLPHKRYVIDLAIKNIGATAAHDIKVEITPRPRRGCGGTDDIPVDVWLPTNIPVLIPGQEWRTRWDLAMYRKDKDKSEFPDKHKAIVTFTDSQKCGPERQRHRFEYEFVLDWGMYWGTIGMDDE